MLSLAAMKLELALGFAALLAIAGCASSQPQRAEAAKAPTVSTTKLMAADVQVDTETSDAPKVSKPQHAVEESEATVDTNVDKDFPVRKSEHRHGGGFSGYK
jgi:hypothetical protein